jgi:tRNA (uracil-5-)-methyltransferase TRM9
VSWQLRDKDALAADAASGMESDGSKAVFNRYYHLFREGELEALVRKVPSASIGHVGYERDNWYVIGTKQA